MKIIKKRSIFSIYVCIFVVIMGLLHGFFMASANTEDRIFQVIEISDNNSEKETKHLIDHNSDNMKTANKNSSFGICCDENSFNIENSKFYQNRKSETIYLEIDNFDIENHFNEKLNSYKYLHFRESFSPPEKTLKKVIKKE